jgi:hypothetical protein
MIMKFDKIYEQIQNTNACLYSKEYNKELNENYVTTVSKAKVSAVAKMSWALKDNSFDLFKLPVKSQEVGKKGNIRLGIVEKSGIFFWDADILHDAVENILNKVFDIKLVYTIGSDTLNIKPINGIFPGQFGEFLEKNKMFLDYFKDIKKSFPKIKKAIIGRETINL